MWQHLNIIHGLLLFDFCLPHQVSPFDVEKGGKTQSLTKIKTQIYEEKNNQTNM